MENASKALIIAGSILLSILIIALGMYIFGQAGSSTDASQLSALEISAFNGQFDKYAGSQRGSQIKDLISSLIANARSNDTASERPTVLFEGFGEDDVSDEFTSDEISGKGDDYITKLQQNRKEIADSHRYKVTIGIDDNSDLVNKVTINYNVTADDDDDDDDE